MEGRANPEDVARVIVFFLACGVIISCFTELMLDAIESLRARESDDYDTWAGWWHHHGQY